MTTREYTPRQKLKAEYGGRREREGEASPQSVRVRVVLKPAQQRVEIPLDIKEILQPIEVLDECLRGGGRGWTDAEGKT